MGKTYSHLSAEERAAIMIEQSRQTSCRGIARLLGRSVSTVSRELSRNRTEQSEAYDATAAAKGYRARREPRGSPISLPCQPGCKKSCAVRRMPFAALPCEPLAGTLGSQLLVAPTAHQSPIRIKAGAVLCSAPGGFAAPENPLFPSASNNGEPCRFAQVCGSSCDVQPLNGSRCGHRVATCSGGAVARVQSGLVVFPTLSLTRAPRPIDR
ncbi:helix-turn-helix domain-containing protein [Niveibacterium terrae]|uniref:helix-turn-helix domain-containing protein n=1 Tax=Niveibacterium terrae TaxID=3373598 RepID=UPI003A901107